MQTEPSDCSESSVKAVLLQHRTNLEKSNWRAYSSAGGRTDILRICMDLIRCRIDVLYTSYAPSATPAERVAFKYGPLSLK